MGVRQRAGVDPSVTTYGEWIHQRHTQWDNGWWGATYLQTSWSSLYSVWLRGARVGCGTWSSWMTSFCKRSRRSLHIREGDVL